MSSVDERRPVAVELFAGVGGMSLGFEQAGFDVLAAVDVDPVHLAVHSFNFPLTEAVCGDISTIDSAVIQSAARKGWAAHGRGHHEWDGIIDCLFGGPSCQGFSDMGTKRADDERNDLVIQFARLVEELRPRTFVMENVAGLLGRRYRGTVAELHARLRGAGYKLQSESPVRLDASDFGVPQERKRVFIVGALDKVPLVPRTRGLPPTVADALDDLPEVNDFDGLLHVDELYLDHDQLNALEGRISSYAFSLRERRGREYGRRWDKHLLGGCSRTVHSPRVIDRFVALGPGALDAPSRTRRLNADTRSFTLRAGTGRDHGSFTAPRPVHHRSARVITVREAARLHSFPDWFRFHVTKWHGLREIGNAVPPRLAEAMACEVIDALGCRPPRPSRILPAADTRLLSFSLREAADHFGIDHALLPYDVRRKTPKHN